MRKHIVLLKHQMISITVLIFNHIIYNRVNSIIPIVVNTFHQLNALLSSCLRTAEHRSTPISQRLSVLDRHHPVHRNSFNIKTAACYLCFSSTPIVRCSHISSLFSYVFHYVFILGSLPVGIWLLLVIQRMVLSMALWATFRFFFVFY